MPKKRSWTDEKLVAAVAGNKSYRAVLIVLHLIPVGGNYVQVQRRTKELNLVTGHFTGRGWNVGRQFVPNPPTPLVNLLVKDGTMQSFQLKGRLYAAGLKEPKCELCGWAQISPDGRIPVELDHVNGDHSENRLENLWVLCPNCHSLQATDRGKNKKVGLRYARVS